MPTRAHDRVALAALLVAAAALFAPMVYGWIQGALFEERHELLIAGVSAWLLWRRRDQITALPTPERSAAPASALALGLLLHLAGAMLDSDAARVVALLIVCTALLWLLKGGAAVRASAFPLGFLLFAVPLPHEVVLWLTGPLKEGVSAAATSLLAAVGLPAGRSGVVITIGQYQLLVLEACAGLQTMFTLEAMGLLYTNLVHRPSTGRSIALALLVVPISFAANVVRVIALALVTLYWGDAAGQGFLHGFAGIFLFLVALVLLVLVDGLLGRWWSDAEAQP